MDGDDRAVAYRAVPAIRGKFGNVGEECSHQAPGTTVFEAVSTPGSALTGYKTMAATRTIVCGTVERFPVLMRCERGTYTRATGKSVRMLASSLHDRVAD